MAHSFRNNNKPSVEEFKKKHPELFKGEESEGEGLNFSRPTFKVPSESASELAYKIQEGLNKFPKGRTKNLLTDYYNSMTLDELTKKYKAKSKENMSVLIYKAKNRVLKFYKKMKETPIDSTKYVVIKVKVIKLGESVSHVIKVGMLDLSEEPFWVGPSLLRLDDDVQDFLETDSRYINDFVFLE